jgi:hypothetical protein
MARPMVLALFHLANLRPSLHCLHHRDVIAYANRPWHLRGFFSDVFATTMLYARLIDLNGSSARVQTYSQVSERNCRL